MKSVNSTLYALLAQVMPKVTATILFILLARQLGRTQAGIYSLSTTFVTIALLLSSFGLEELLVREVARDQGRARLFFNNLVVLRGLLSLAAFGVLWLALAVIFHYDAFVSAMILLTAASLLPESLTDIVQSLFVATGRMSWMAASSTALSVSQLIVGGVVIARDGRLPSLLIVIVIHSYLGCILNLALAGRLMRRASSPTGPSSRISVGFCRQQIRQSPPFIAINTFSVLESQIDVALLSVLGSIEQVGIYAAAKTIISSLAIFSQAFRIALYPVLARLWATSLARLKAVYDRAFRYLVAISFGLAGVLVMAAPVIIQLLYKERFMQAVEPLQILAIPLVVGFIYIPSTRLIVAGHQERRLSALLAVSFGTNLLANLALIPTWGPIGCAVARSLSSVVYFVMCDAYVSRKFFPTGSWPVMARALPGALAMAALAYLIRPYSPVLALAAGMAAYALLVVYLHLIEATDVARVAREYRQRGWQIVRGWRANRALHRQ